MPHKIWHLRIIFASKCTDLRFYTCNIIFTTFSQSDHRSLSWPMRGQCSSHVICPGQLEVSPSWGYPLAGAPRPGWDKSSSLDYFCFRFRRRPSSASWAGWCWWGWRSRREPRDPGGSWENWKSLEWSIVVTQFEFIPFCWVECSGYYLTLNWMETVDNIRTLHKSTTLLTLIQWMVRRNVHHISKKIHQIRLLSQQQQCSWH